MITSGSNARICSNGTPDVLSSNVGSTSPNNSSSHGRMPFSKPAPLNDSMATGVLPSARTESWLFQPIVTIR